MSGRTPVPSRSPQFSRTPDWSPGRSVPQRRFFTLFPKKGSTGSTGIVKRWRVSWYRRTGWGVRSRSTGERPMPHCRRVLCALSGCIPTNPMILVYIPSEYQAPESLPWEPRRRQGRPIRLRGRSDAPRHRAEGGGYASAVVGHFWDCAEREFRGRLRSLSGPSARPTAPPVLLAEVVAHDPDRREKLACVPIEPIAII